MYRLVVCMVLCCAWTPSSAQEKVNWLQKLPRDPKWALVQMPPKGEITLKARQDNKILLQLEANAPIAEDAAFSDAGDQVVILFPSKVALYDLKTGRKLWTVERPPDVSRGVFFPTEHSEKYFGAGKRVFVFFGSLEKPTINTYLSVDDGSVFKPTFQKK